MSVDAVLQQVEAARAGVERSRYLAQGWPSSREDPNRIADEVKELRLALDRLVYAVELLAESVRGEP